MINYIEEEEVVRFSSRQIDKHKKKSKSCQSCGGMNYSIHFRNGIRIGKCCDACGTKKE